MCLFTLIKKNTTKKKSQATRQKSCCCRLREVVAYDRCSFNDFTEIILGGGCLRGLIAQGRSSSH